MSKKELKTYGRTKVNKLDWLMAIACCIVAGAALWISLGISIANAGDKVGQAFTNVVASLGFVASVKLYGQSAVVIAYDSVIIYGSVALLVLGSIYLFKKNLKERVPGLVAELIAALGFAFYVSFVHECLGGEAKGAVNGFWPISLIVFLIVLFVLMVFATVVTFNTKYNVSMDKDAEEEAPVEEEPVEEEKAEEPAPEEEPEEEAEEEAPVEEEPVEEEKAEEPAPEEEPEEDAEEEELEEEDEDEGDEDEEEETGEEGEENAFSGLGKRKKRVPFENKIRRASPETREKYKALVTGLREYEFNDRKSIPGETFSYKKEKMIFITISGSNLKVYFKLDPAEFADSTIPIKDASDIKKYSATPACLKVKSNLAVRRALALGKRIAEENNVPKK